MTEAVHRVAVLPGDGIGREVVPAAQRVLERVGQLHGFGFEWDELEPAPEAPGVLRRVDLPIAVVTNCSEDLGVRAAALLGVDLAAVVTTERVGFYKPHPDTYRCALTELDVPAERALYLAGSPYDVAGADAVGMPIVWHDRAGLRSAGDPPVRAVIDSLEPLLEHVPQRGGKAR